MVHLQNLDPVKLAASQVDLLYIQQKYSITQIASE